MSDPSSVAGLNLWVKADTGVYSDAGSTLATDGQTVQQWNDQSGSGNNLTQATSGSRPKFQNSSGNLSVNFGDNINSITSTMSLPGGYSVNLQSFTLFMVVEVNSIGRTEYILSLTSLGMVLMNTPAGLKVYSSGFYTTTLQLPTQRCVIVVRFNASNVVFYVNSISNTQSTGTVGSGTVSGGVVSDVVDGAPFSGRVFDLALYNNDIGSTNTSTLISYAVSKYSISTAATDKQVILAGDSITEGLGSTNFMTWWRQMSIPSMRFIYDFAVAGSKISDETAFSSNMDSVTSISLTDYCFVFLGTNDLSAGRTGAQVYADLQTFCAARKSGGADIVILFTLTVNNFTTDRDALNTSLRGDFTTAYSTYKFGAKGGVTYADYLIDIAVDPNIGTGSSHSATYWFDGVHYTNTGYGVMAGIVAAAFPELISSGSQQNNILGGCGFELVA